MLGEHFQPIFIFSLPRSGSTLLQRFLACHDQVSTTSEPWFLLPFFYSLRNDGVCAEYMHRSTSIAIRDFTQILPHGRKDYMDGIKDLALKLYSKASKSGCRYFVDKTPRYHLIAENILEAFDQAKFVFLWRNPLAVVASVIESWGKGKWNVYRFHIDLYNGYRNLVNAFRKYRDRVWGLKYEELIENPVENMKGVFDYLDLSFDPRILQNFTDVRLEGRMGDRSFYDTVSRDPLYKWKETFASNIRISWARAYLNWLGSENLSLMGYDLHQLLSELDELSPKRFLVLSDIVRRAYGFIYRVMEPRLFATKLRNLVEDPILSVHSIGDVL